MEDSYWSAKHQAVPRYSGLLGLLLILSVTDRSWAEEPKAGESVNGLQAVLTIQDPLVRQSEAVRLEVELRNVSERPLFFVDPVIQPGSYYGLARTEFMLRRADDAQHGVCDLRADNLIVDGIVEGGDTLSRLDPGASLRSPLPMSLECRDDDYTDGVQPYLEPGRYEVSVLVWFGRGRSSEDAWAGSVRSNWVTFDVVRAE